MKAKVVSKRGRDVPSGRTEGTRRIGMISWVDRRACQTRQRISVERGRDAKKNETNRAFGEKTVRVSAVF